MTRTRRTFGRRPPGDLARRYALWVGRWRWAVLLAGVAITGAALSWLPGVAGAGGGLSGILSTSGPAIQAQIDAIRRFGLPLLTRVAVVQRDPEGMKPAAVARAAERAATLDLATFGSGALSGDRPSGEGVLAAFPLINSPLLVPRAGEHDTTVITYLFTDPTTGLLTQNGAAYDYAEGFDQPGDALVGVAGSIPAQIAQGTVIGANLPVVEATTLAAIALIVGLNFRSVVAPLITIVTAAGGYLLADRTIGALSTVLGAAAPAELEPIVVALMLGITTDYSIFFLSGLQRRLREGQRNPQATRAAVQEYLPIVVTAGFTVACGVAALVVARSGLFRELGPGLAVTVLVGLGVAVTAVPAMLFILGRWAFWPSRFPAPLEATADPQATTLASGTDQQPARGPSASSRVIGLLRSRRVSAGMVAAVVVVLAVATWPLFGTRSAVAPLASLPADTPVRVAGTAAAMGFAPGILSPTEVIVSAPGIAAETDALLRLDAALQHEPGVTTVLGPGDQPPYTARLGLFLAPGGGATRFLLAFDSDPLGATAIGHLRTLRADMPGLLAAAGLTGAEVAYAGDTAVGQALVEAGDADLGRVALAVGLVSLVLLVLFLRALVAPLYLLASSVLAVGASLGLTTWVFQDLLGADGLIFYVPFAAAVLLVALGSDYNIFSVGYIWDQARHHSLHDALAIAVPRSTRAISVAGLALAVSFALVALTPLASFRELAFALGVGVVIDAFLVRSLLVPALITLVGPVSGWPGRRLTRPDHPADAAPEEPR